jgi:hypothetical protein
MLRFHVREVFECAIDIFERDYQRYTDQYCHDHRQCRTWLCCLMCCTSKQHEKKIKKKSNIDTSDQHLPYPD